MSRPGGPSGPRHTPHAFDAAHPGAPAEPRDICSICGLVRAAYVHEVVSGEGLVLPDSLVLSRAVGVLLRRVREDASGGEPLTTDEYELLNELSAWWENDGRRLTTASAGSSTPEGT